MQVAEYMLTHSTTTNPVLVGSSVHNVRIERLWRDTFRCVLSVFYQLFHFLEETGRLDPSSEKDLYCLHYIYLPRINMAVRNFSEGWNNHALTTERCMTPMQLFTGGMLSTGMQPSHMPTTSESHNVGLEGSGIHVPEITIPLTLQDEALLQSTINPLSESTNYAIELYEQTKTFVDNLCN